MEDKGSRFGFSVLPLIDDIEHRFEFEFGRKFASQFGHDNRFIEV